MKRHNARPDKRRIRKSNKFMEYFDNYNVEIFVEDYDSLDKAIRKFTREVKEAGIMEDCYETKVYEKPSDKKRRKKRETDYNFRKNSKG